MRSRRSGRPTAYDSKLSTGSRPELASLQGGTSEAPAIQEALRASAGRRSTVLIAAITTLSMLVGGMFAALSVQPIGWRHASICVLSAFAVLASKGRFRTRMVPDLAGQLSRVGSSVIVGAAIPFVVLAVQDSQRTNFRAFSVLVLALFTSAVIGDFVAAVTVRRMWASGRLRSKAVLVGQGRLAHELTVEIRLREEYGVDLVGVVDPKIDDLKSALVGQMAHTRADRVIFAPLSGGENGVDLVDAARTVIGLGVPAFVIPRFYELGVGLDSMSPDRARGYPMVRVQRSAHPSIALRIKRAVDVLVSGAALLALSPVLVGTSLAVLVTSGRPILFRQPRVGRGGVVFDMLKFRSMTSAANEHSERTSAHRVTALGRVLRAASIDELPQFWNIFRGDMSLVGPRPERVTFVEEGLGRFEGYAHRHRLPMGLTGLAQVAGLRGEDTSVPERVKFDNLYIDQWSLALDIQIILKTALAVVLQSRYRRREIELSHALQLAKQSTAGRAPPTNTSGVQTSGLLNRQHIADTSFNRKIKQDRP